MNFVLWILQALLALLFLAVGIPKMIVPIPQLAKRVAWAGEIPPWLVRFIGVSEVLGAIGLILPAVTGIAPWLTIAAAVGLVVAMLSAVVFHFSRAEFAGSVPSAVLLLLVLVIAVGRWKLTVI
jgi:putative oxidoreductase